MTTKQWKIESDIENFIMENQHLSEMKKMVDGQLVNKEIEDLTPWEKISAFLQWNGMINWTDQIIDLVEYAGWKRQ